MSLKEPQFRVGQTVRVSKMIGFTRMNWEGVVEIVRDVGADYWEYQVSNGPLLGKACPLLLWEPELTLKEK